jgi:transposase
MLPSTLDQQGIAAMATQPTDGRKVKSAPASPTAAAAIGPIGRFKRPDQLVAYFGLNPSVRQSGDGRPQHGRIPRYPGPSFSQADRA